MSNFENDPHISNSSELDNNNSKKSLLTQEFNTIPPGNSLATTNSSATTMASNNFSLYSAPSFLMSPDDTSAHPAHALAPSHVPAPAYFYHPFPFNPPPPQMFSPEQYYIMMRSSVQNSSAHSMNSAHNAHSAHSPQSVLLPVQPASKRIKLGNNEAAVSNSLADQLNGFKNSLKSSFDRNLQKLEVLDRLVQTVQLKGSLQYDSLRGALDLLRVTRTLLKELTSEQVDMTATLTSEIRNCLLPDILKLLRSSRFVAAAHAENATTNDCSKVELLDKLRKEEDSHLADLTILSTRNKELQKDQRALKDQLDRLQLEYSDSLKMAARRKDDHDQFLTRIRTLLGIEEIDSSSQQISQVCLIEGVAAILTEKQTLLERENRTKNDLRSICTEIQGLKQEFETFDGPPVDYVMIEDCLQGTLSLLFDKFEEISQSRERFFNNSLNLFTRRIEELARLQSELTHKSLSLRVSLQGQLSDSHETAGRLRRHCQELTADLESGSADRERMRLALQVKESESSEFKRRYETSQERLKVLEQELSIKNQESRTFAIRIQGLEAEAEETRIQNRHDISALERKISILESRGSENGNHKLISSNHPKMEEFVDLDPFSSVVSHVNDQSDCHIGNVSVIPATVAPKRNDYMVTFTGIRDSQKQKELTGWIHELGGVVHVGADFNDDITHVLAPRGYRSIRVLAASLTGKWIVPIEWVEASHRAGHFVPEPQSNGFNNTSIRPFRFRTLWMSAAFSATHKSHPVYPVAALRTLLEKLGKARWAETQGSADLLLVTEEEKESKLITSGRGVLVTLNNLISMIPIE